MRSKGLIAIAIALATVVAVAHVGRAGRQYTSTFLGLDAAQWERFDQRSKQIRAGKPGMDARGLIQPAGAGWRYTMALLPASAHPFGATDTDEECETETNQMCADAGHGSGSGNSERTQHAAEDGGGCTCTQTCERNGAIAFVDSNEPCG